MLSYAVLFTVLIIYFFFLRYCIASFHFSLKDSLESFIWGKTTSEKLRVFFLFVYFVFFQSVNVLGSSSFLKDNFANIEFLVVSFLLQSFEDVILVPFEFQVSNEKQYINLIINLFLLLLLLKHFFLALFKILSSFSAVYHWICVCLYWSLSVYSTGCLLLECVD